MEEAVSDIRVSTERIVDGEAVYYNPDETRRMAREAIVAHAAQELRDSSERIGLIWGRIQGAIGASLFWLAVWLLREWR